MAHERADLLAELTEESDGQDYAEGRPVWRRSVTTSRVAVAGAFAAVALTGVGLRQYSSARPKSMRANHVIMEQDMGMSMEDLYVAGMAPDAVAVQPQIPADMPAMENVAAPQPDPMPPMPVPMPVAPQPPPGPDLTKFEHCAANGQNCEDLKCCREPGMQCYQKSKFWSECREACEPGLHMTDTDSTPWTCDPLGDRTPGEAQVCSKDGEDCRNTKCCQAPGNVCFEKNEYWAACRPACQTLDFTQPTSDPWTCAELGPRAPGAGAWVAEECSKDGEDCSSTKCCAEPGKSCFRKEEGYATCRYDCTPGFKENPWETAWSCEQLGPQTPAAVQNAPTKGQVQPWVEKECVAEGEDCTASKCCSAVGWMCYKKNEYWSQCLPGGQCPPPAERRLVAQNDTRRLDVPEAAPAVATPAPAPPADPWDCAALGPESWGLPVRGYPSLYCVTLYMPSSYEGELMHKQLDREAGIFACDGFELVASDEVILGSTKDGHLCKTLVIPKIEVGVSQDGTAGNAKLFMAFWDKIIASKRFRNYDWTIKADPDAVLIPPRLRSKLWPYMGQRIYIVNCNKYPSSPNFPMMFGSVEIFSMGAMYDYAGGSWKCGQDLPWGGWGEDYYMTHCLDYLGVGRINEFTVVGDNVCTGADCNDGSKGSFHPFKTVVDWETCWNQATR